MTKSASFEYSADSEGIHILSYRGTIDLALGRSSMDHLQSHLESLASDPQPIALLLDLRETLWESNQTHDTLSWESRHRFSQPLHGAPRRLAVLNNQYDQILSPLEGWFTDPKAARSWLLHNSPNL